MTEQLISLETARLAKDNGFDWPCTAYHARLEEESFGLPTQSLLQKWLRDVYDLVIVIRRSGDSWHWYIQGIIEDGYESTYEEALEAGLLAGLDIIRNETK